jgi:hypothetical protein
MRSATTSQASAVVLPVISGLISKRSAAIDSIP